MPAIALLLLRRLLCGLGGFLLSASALAASRIAFLTSSHLQSPLVRGTIVFASSSCLSCFKWP
jgi:hypothetical protein